MEYSKQKIFMNCFALLCISITVSLGSYWSYQFALNEDLSVVSYKVFRGTKDDIFPTTSLCLRNPFLKEKLAEYGVNETSYLAFLEGKSITDWQTRIKAYYRFKQVKSLRPERRAWCRFDQS